LERIPRPELDSLMERVDFLLPHFDLRFAKNS